MNRIKNFKILVLRYFKPSNLLAFMALTFASIAANTFCAAIYHQPEKPDLKSLRKF